MKFTSNEELAMEIKVLLLRENISLTQLAKKIGMSQPAFSKKLQKKNMSFEDVSIMLDGLGYDLEINFIKREG